MTKRSFSFTYALLPLAAFVIAGCATEDELVESQTDSLVRCAGVEGPAKQSPFSDPPRCEMRPVMVDGNLTTDDPRSLWCEYGSCGRSGEATCRTVDERTTVRTFVECNSGATHCQRCRFRRVECGTAKGCRDHDACYDERFRNNEADSFDLWMALRAYCDAPIALEYPTADWWAWMEGKPGPSGFESYLPYQEDLGCVVTSGACE